MFDCPISQVRKYEEHGRSHWQAFQRHENPSFRRFKWGNSNGYDTNISHYFRICSIATLLHAQVCTFPGQSDPVPDTGALTAITRTTTGDWKQCGRNRHRISASSSHSTFSSPSWWPQMGDLVHTVYPCVLASNNTSLLTAPFALIFILTDRVARNQRYTMEQMFIMTGNLLKTFLSWLGLCMWRKSFLSW